MARNVWPITTIINQGFPIIPTTLTPKNPKASLVSVHLWPHTLIYTCAYTNVHTHSTHKKESWASFMDWTVRLYSLWPSGSLSWQKFSLYLLEDFAAHELWFLFLYTFQLSVTSFVLSKVFQPFSLCRRVYSCYYDLSHVPCHTEAMSSLPPSESIHFHLFLCWDLIIVALD